MLSVLNICLGPIRIRIIKKKVLTYVLLHTHKCSTCPKFLILIVLDFHVWFQVQCFMHHGPDMLKSEVYLMFRFFLKFGNLHDMNTRNLVDITVHSVWKAPWQIVCSENGADGVFWKIKCCWSHFANNPIILFLSSSSSSSTFIFHL